MRSRLIAFSFDDGPDEKTAEILDLLDQYEALGTFFVLGRQVQGREEVIRRAVEAGHEIGNHTFDHPHLDTLEPSQIEDELARTSDVIEAAVGLRPRLMRPPYGMGDALRAAPVARRLGMKTVRWSVNPKDWNESDPDRISDAILAGARPGAVVVLHDGAAHGGDRSPTLAALRTAVPQLRAQGYSLVTVSTLLKRAPWAARTVVPRGPLRRVVDRGRRWVRSDPEGSVE
ncbi:MAG: polysaccharide deacetylase family protein [Chloroflexota bacterium]|nr:polysaccharide deacetylase family protein [Chloroflexota bacterium]